jgi:hypothetical protein
MGGGWGGDSLETSTLEKCVGLLLCKRTCEPLVKRYFILPSLVRSCVKKIPINLGDYCYSGSTVAAIPTLRTRRTSSFSS